LINMLSEESPNTENHAEVEADAPTKTKNLSAAWARFEAMVH